MSWAKPRLERCGNHWCVETFDEWRFFSRCYKTWAEALRVALRIAGAAPKPKGPQ